MLDRLTSKQLHALRLAAEGLSNKQIGQRMGLSHRTAEWHLQNAYRALGVSDREEAYGLLLDHYRDLRAPLPNTEPAPPDRMAETERTSRRSDPVNGARHGLYGVYANLGAWRTPPRTLGGRIVLIVAVAAVILVLFGGGLALMSVGFEVVQAIRLGGK